MTALAPIRPGIGYRQPPASIDAEMALLGAILVNNKALDAVSDFLRPEHFADSVHGRIYRAAVVLVEQGRQASPGTLHAQFASDPGLVDQGGARYLAELAANALGIIEAGAYGRAILDLALRREVIAIGERAVAAAYDADVDRPAAEIVEATERELFELVTEGPGGGFVSFDEAADEALRRVEAAYQRQGVVGGVPTGIAALDRIVGALSPSDLIVLAGRPGMGKTALATNIADDAARAGLVVAFFSLEMSRDQLLSRILAGRAGIETHRLPRGAITHAEFQQLIDARRAGAGSGLRIDDTPGLSVAAMRTRARRLARRAGRLDLIVVDYLQLMQAGGRAAENRVQEISAITRGVKLIAKELNVPVLALSQLSRAVEQREDKRPQLADLRDSGTIEQDADVVLFVYRESYYLERLEPPADDPKWAEWAARAEAVAGRAEIIVSKNRHGPTGIAHAAFDGPTQRFAGLAADGLDPRDGGR